MLGFILYCIAGFSFWISSLGTSITPDKEDVELLQYTNGEVLKESFVYYSLQDEGDLRITLKTLEGDADIYIAQHSKVPTYEPDEYDLHSASCGEDVINVPSSFRRPIVIGIYGNSAYSNTKYRLKVEEIPNNECENVTFHGNVEEDETSSRNTNKIASQNENVGITNKKPKTEAKKSNDVKSGIFGLLEILAMVL